MEDKGSRFQILRFYSSFSGDIMAVKGLMTHYDTAAPKMSLWFSPTRKIVALQSPFTDDTCLRATFVFPFGTACNDHAWVFAEGIHTDCKRLARRLRGEQRQTVNTQRVQ